MSRRTRAVKRPITPDPVYGSEMVTKFVNTLMLDGNPNDPLAWVDCNND